MKAIGWSLVLVLAALAAASSQAQTPERRKLGHGTMIQGYPCAKGWAWFYANQQLKSCAVTVEIPFASITIPPGSIVDLTTDGKPLLVQLSHDTQVDGYTAQGGSLLGAGEGPMVAFYSDGKVREFYLAGDQTVDGVPCAHGGLVSTTLHGDPSVVLNPDGHLKACRLAEDYAGQKKGDRFSR